MDNTKVFHMVCRQHVLGNVYFSASRAIGDHNRVRQDLFRLEFVWKRPISGPLALGDFSL